MKKSPRKCRHNFGVYFLIPLKFHSIFVDTKVKSAIRYGEKTDNVRRFVTALTWSCAPDHFVHKNTASTPAVTFTDMASVLPDNVQNTKFFLTFKNISQRNILICTVYRFRDICAISVAYLLRTCSCTRTQNIIMRHGSTHNSHIPCSISSNADNHVNYRYQQILWDCKRLFTRHVRKVTMLKFRNIRSGVCIRTSNLSRNSRPVTGIQKVYLD